MSVGSFVLVTAAWPLSCSIPTGTPNWADITRFCFSPVVVCVIFVNFFISRTYGFFGGLVWSGTFWAVEVFTLAMGLLWLTVRTFDGSFDRIPDRPQGISIRTVVVLILSGMIGAGSLVGAIDCWIEGVKPESLSLPISFAITAYFSADR